MGRAGAFSFERDIVPLLPRVAKPARYTGGEYNSIVRPESECVFALAYPDVYEIGMSNLGLRILYEALSRVSGCAAERVYLPWPDMCDLLGEKGFPLCKKGSVEGHNMLLAGYGNAIVPELAAEFIKALLIELTEKEVIFMSMRTKD